MEISILARCLDNDPGSRLDLAVVSRRNYSFSHVFSGADTLRRFDSAYRSWRQNTQTL